MRNCLKGKERANMTSNSGCDDRRSCVGSSSSPSTPRLLVVAGWYAETEQCARVWVGVCRGPSPCHVIFTRKPVHTVSPLPSPIPSRLQRSEYWRDEQRTPRDANSSVQNLVSSCKYTSRQITIVRKQGASETTTGGIAVLSVFLHAWRLTFH